MGVVQFAGAVLQGAHPIKHVPAMAVAAAVIDPWLIASSFGD
jgi:hypothetical protein